MRLPSWLSTAWTRLAPVIAALFPKLGIGLLLLAAGFAANSWNHARPQVRAQAVVTENMASFAAEGGVVYAPRLRFRAADGTLLLFTAAPAQDDPEFQPGTTLPVLYPAGHPDQAVLATVGRLYHWAIVFALWGVAIFDAGWVVRSLARRRVTA